MITNERICELASGENVKTRAVQNFLSTLDGMSYQEAVANVELDGRLYRWSHETKAVIRIGLLEHYFGKAG